MGLASFGWPLATLRFVLVRRPWVLNNFSGHSTPNSSPKAALATKSQHLHPQGTNMTQPVTMRFPIFRESKLHKILRLPRNMGADLHQMLRLPREVNICSINART